MIDDLIKQRAEEFEMSMGDFIRFLGTRSCVEVAAELLGYEFVHYGNILPQRQRTLTIAQVNIFLENEGYILPKLYWDTPGEYIPITQRQYEHCIAIGMSHKQIAQHLRITVNSLMHWADKWRVK